jgi:PAS domain S-box-containing protein
MPESSEPRWRLSPRLLVTIIGLVFVYVLVAKLGLMLDAMSGFATLVWGATGIALSALLLLGYRVWPGVWVGAFVVNLWVGAPWLVAAGIAVGNTLEALLGAYALRRLAGFKGSFFRLRHVMGLVLAAAVGCTVVSATIGVTSLWLGGVVPASRFRATWSAWWMGDVLGDLIVAPLILSWASPFERRVRLADGGEALLLLASLTAVSTAVFFRPAGPAPHPFQAPYVLFPLFIWAALRFELRGATAATLVVSALAIWATVLGLGPFANGGRLAQSLFALQTFMACAALTPLVVGGAMSDRAHAVRAREGFVATVSHDLQNPLGAIQLSAASLARALPEVSESRVRTHEQLVQRNVDRMLHLVRDLLDASAIDAGRLSIDLRAESAPNLVHEAVELLAPLAAAKRQELTVSSAEAVQVLCDRRRILQVLSNLIGNAVKFSEEGRPIRLRIDRVGDAARFSVADAGPGIDPAQLRHIFERYWGAKHGEGGGTGLGLYLASGIIGAHGGQLQAESKLGVGSTFHFTLPLLTESAGRVFPAATRVAATPAPGALSTSRARAVAPGAGAFLIADPVSLLEGLFAHAPLPFQIYRSDGHCVFVNEAFRDLLGGDPPPEYNVFRDEALEQQGFLALVHRAFSGEAVLIPPHWVERRDVHAGQGLAGGRVGIEGTLFPLRDRSGNVGHVALSMKDVTAALQRQHAMEALRESEARKAAVIEGALDCIISMDQGGLVTEFNPAAERTFGYSRSEALGQPLADLIIPHSFRTAHCEGLKRYLATGEAPVIGRRLEMTAMRSDGTLFPVELIVTRSTSKAHPIFTGFVRDLTEQRRVERALAKSEARFRRLLEAGIIGILTADVRGNVLDANATFLELVGYSADEVRAGHVRWSDMTPQEWRYLDERAIAQLRETGVAPAWEKEYVRRDGTRVRVLVGVAMLDDKLGQCVAFVLDVTARREAEAAIDQLRREREADLEASVRVRDDFLAVASHELKTPLAALLMQIQGLRRAVRQDAIGNVGDRLRKAEGSGLRLERLINQLLDVSRITAGTLRLEPTLFDLGDVVREVAARLSDPSTAGVDPILVRCDPQICGRWDRLRMDQVVSNLLTNALKYGQGKPVEVELHVSKLEAVLRVIDHGIGIDRTHQERIFQRFERAVATRDFGGFGLGLWITRQIVEASGGRIEVDSAPDQGATFTVRLPVRPIESSAEARDAHP